MIGVTDGRGGSGGGVAIGGAVGVEMGGGGGVLITTVVAVGKGGGTGGALFGGAGGPFGKRSRAAMRTTRVGVAVGEGLATGDSAREGRGVSVSPGASVARTVTWGGIVAVGSAGAA